MGSIRIIFLLLALSALLLEVVIAATVHGSIYDLSLKKIPGAKVEVNTTPVQFLISNDGLYSFDIPRGSYAIKAEIRQNDVVSSENKNISIIQEGKYVIDLILFPSFEEEDDIAKDLDLSFPEAENSNFAHMFIGLSLFILGAIALMILKGKKGNKKDKNNNDRENIGERIKEENAGLDSVLKIINKEGGRTTQKEIRKHIPLSEAKIRLMIAELEHKGVIEKIKKGRGNILILKK